MARASRAGGGKRGGNDAGEEMGRTGGGEDRRERRGEEERAAQGSRVPWTERVGGRRDEEWQRCGGGDG